MKRVILALLVAAAIVTSCSKEEDKKNYPDSIVGTSWSASSFSNGNFGSMDLNFLSSNFVKIRINISPIGKQEDGIIEVEKAYTYSQGKGHINNDTNATIYFYYKDADKNLSLHNNKLTVIKDGSYIDLDNWAVYDNAGNKIGNLSYVDIEKMKAMKNAKYEIDNASSFSFVIEQNIMKAKSGAMSGVNFFKK